MNGKLFNRMGERHAGLNGRYGSALSQTATAALGLLAAVMVES